MFTKVFKCIQLLFHLCLHSDNSCCLPFLCLIMPSRCFLQYFQFHKKWATFRARRHTWPLMLITLSSSAHRAKMLAVTGARNLSGIRLVETSVNQTSRKYYRTYISSSSNISLIEMILVAGCSLVGTLACWSDQVRVENLQNRPH